MEKEMKYIIDQHPRLAHGVEVEVRSQDGFLQDAPVFLEATLEKSIEEAKLHAETFYPNHKVEVRNVCLPNGQ
jgi:hypothetical protein